MRRTDDADDAHLRIEYYEVRAVVNVVHAIDRRLRCVQHPELARERLQCGIGRGRAQNPRREVLRVGTSGLRGITCWVDRDKHIIGPRTLRHVHELLVDFSQRRHCPRTYVRTIDEPEKQHAVATSQASGVETAAIAGFQIEFLQSARRSVSKQALEFRRCAISVPAAQAEP